MKKSLIILTLLLVVGLLGYLFFQNRSHFTTEKWLFTDGVPREMGSTFTRYPKRDAIVNDLITHYDLKKRNYREIIELLGEADDSIEDSLKNEYGLVYPILIDYEWNIDPQHTKDLIIIFDLKNGIMTPKTSVKRFYLDDYYAK